MVRSVLGKAMRDLHDRTRLVVRKPAMYENLGAIFRLEPKGIGAHLKTP